MSIHVGTAPDSWGVWRPLDPLQTPWQRFLDEVAESGYAAIELGPFGYLPTDPQRVSEELERRSLQLAGGTISGDLSAPDGWQAMRATTASICDVLEPLGARFLVLLDAGHAEPAAAVAQRELDEPGWGHMRETVHRLGEYTATRGIAAVFHPHADTTIQFEPQIERFLALTDAALVNLCLDVGHHAYAGGDAVRFFRDHHARIPYLHLKDVDPVLSQRARQRRLVHGSSGDRRRVRRPGPGLCGFSGPEPRRRTGRLRRLGHRGARHVSSPLRQAAANRPPQSTVPARPSIG